MSKGIPLVTGATGFAGTHLVEHLLAFEPAVAAWGNRSGRSRGNDHPRVSWSAVDITDMADVTHLLSDLQPSAIYHCAGIADVNRSWSDSARPLRVNAFGTHVVLEAVSRARLPVPVLVTGSALVYRPSAGALTEESPLGPPNPYGVSKLAQEMIAAGADARVLLTRPFNHAGPGQSDAYVTSGFARQIAEAEAGLREPILRVGNLESRRDITDVRDVVRAYRLIVERGRPGRPYNVCRGEAYRVGDLMEKLIAQSRVPISIEADPRRLRPSDNPVVLGNADRLRADTGWEPQIDIDRTLTDLLNHWRRTLTERGTAR